MKSDPEMTGEPLSSNSGWYHAVCLCEAYLRRPGKTDVLLERLPDGLEARDRRLCQFLFFGVVRNFKLIEFAVKSFIKKQPRPKLKSILFVAGFELLSGDVSRAPKIIDHAVSQAQSLVSSREAGMVNAVLRRLLPVLLEPESQDQDPVAQWALTWSHPEWLVQRWLQGFGADLTQKLLIWDQKPAPVYLRLRKHSLSSPSDNLEFTRWPGFYLFNSRAWPEVEQLLQQGKAFIQDPSSRLPVELLAVRPGERVLDLCAAPGGKSVLIAEELTGGDGLLVCLDKSASRLERLKENLRCVKKVEITIFESDLRETTPAEFEARNLPSRFDAVLLDAPCSNTGVLRRRPDAKWRLRPDDISRMSELQYLLLRRAVEFVRPGGRLVYSTCSLEPEENHEVVEKFISQTKGAFRLEHKRSYTPWQNYHDGGSAFLLIRE